MTLRDSSENITYGCSGSLQWIAIHLCTKDLRERDGMLAAIAWKCALCNLSPSAGSSL